MNVLVVVSDTFRRDHLGAYGNEWIQTPHLDALASESVVFDQAHSGSFPTLPCRAEMFTGKFIFPYLNWGPLPRSETLLSQTFADAGYTTVLVTDNLPMSREGYGYDRGFHSRRRVRGQWYDNYRPADAPFEWPCPPEKLRFSGDGRMQQYLRNVYGWKDEAEYFTPRVIHEATSWLEVNHDRGPWFMHVDLFDPHEPWDPPREYADRYCPSDAGDDIVYPAFGTGGSYSEGDMRRMKALYAGEISMVDHWVGVLLARLEELGRRDDTVVVFLSDHGILLGERGLLGKMGGTMRNLLGWPPYTELSRIPFLIRAPGIAPGRREAFVHPGDVAPTVLDLAGVRVPPTMTASSLRRVLQGEDAGVRDLAVSSWSLRGWSPHRPSVVRTEEWSLVFWRAGLTPELYHRPSDPDEREDVYTAHPKAAAEVHARYLAFLRHLETPRRHLVPRTWMLPGWDRRPRTGLFHAPGEAAGD